jgi:hypothetical protein
LRAQKRDRNEVAIIEALEKAGTFPRRRYLPAVGDLEVRLPNTPLWLLLECKMPGGTITESQAEEFADHPRLIVYSPEEAVDIVQEYKHQYLRGGSWLESRRTR